MFVILVYDVNPKRVAKVAIVNTKVIHMTV